MSVKSHVRACADSVMIALRAAGKASGPDQQTIALVTACRDVVERLQHGAEEVRPDQIDVGLSVLTRAIGELGQTKASTAVVGALRKALDQLQRARTELSA